MITLKKLSTNDGRDVYDMLQKLPLHENGFSNKMNGLTYDEYQDQLKVRKNAEQGVGLQDGYVPDTYFWIYVSDDKNITGSRQTKSSQIPIGVIKIRHYLTDALRKYGGHIGYGIIPEYRGKGHGIVALGLGIEQARKLGISKILLTADADNTASRRIIEKNGGVLIRENENGIFYEVE